MWVIVNGILVLALIWWLIFKADEVIRSLVHRIKNYFRGNYRFVINGGGSFWARVADRDANADGWQFQVSCIEGSGHKVICIKDKKGCVVWPKQSPEPKPSPTRTSLMTPEQHEARAKQLRAGGSLDMEKALALANQHDLLAKAIRKRSAS